MGDAGFTKQAVAWHERRIAFYRAEILRAHEWSRKNNDGDPSLAGTLFEEEYPLLIKEHQKIIRAHKAGKVLERPNV